MNKDEQNRIEEATLDDVDNDFLRDEDLNNTPKRKGRGGRPKGSVNKHVLVRRERIIEYFETRNPNQK